MMNVELHLLHKKDSTEQQGLKCFIIFQCFFYSCRFKTIAIQRKSDSLPAELQIKIRMCTPVEVFLIFSPWQRSCMKRRAEALVGCVMLQIVTRNPRNSWVPRMYSSMVEVAVALKSTRAPHSAAGKERSTKNVFRNIRTFPSTLHRNVHFCFLLIEAASSQATPCQPLGCYVICFSIYLRLQRHWYPFSCCHSLILSDIKIFSWRAFFCIFRCACLVSQISTFRPFFCTLLPRYLCLPRESQSLFNFDSHVEVPGSYLHRNNLH